MRPASQQPRYMHETHKEEEVPIPNKDESKRSFDSVSVKSLTFNSIKLVIFTKLRVYLKSKKKKYCI